MNSLKNEPTKKRKNYFLRFILGLFLVLNLLSFMGAYTLTHFKTLGQKGLGLPRSIGSKVPNIKYITKRLPIGEKEWLETWLIPAKNSLGTVLLFPGNAGSKSNQLIAPAQVFHDLGYDTLLVDFRGVGGSSGSTTTIGIREAKDVAVAVNYAKSAQRPLMLYGISMGSAAILRAIAKEGVNVDGIILELPFTRLLDAVRSRIKQTKLPTFPIAEMVVFWGGVQHRFNGFNHNPVNYATQVKCPSLLLHGRLDKWTTVKQVEQILSNLQGKKELVIFPNAGHNLLITTDRLLWQQSVSRFLEKIQD